MVVVVEWKVENKGGEGRIGEGRGGGGQGKGRGQWLLFPSMFLPQLCNEGEMHALQARATRKEATV